ncbi:putative Histone-lysine N-methyltransferase ATXR6 [Quillaja saponaria]|uniref:[histone H3]-lysine(27) N-methyltransferase n=1 Tax=Quillaja saponaria TaxID=32244 RepID=A0AAD7PSI8_QUISA|nr:putative Histone-lysine N-methyltransferase ATXR6 [Quillaja saponaria]
MVLRRRTLAPKPLPQSTIVDDLFDDEDTGCEECGSGESPAKLLLCDKCNRGYHLFCLRPVLVSVPRGSWFCPSCSKHKRPKSFPLAQTKIVDFFRIQRASELGQTVNHDNGKRKRRPSSLVMSKKSRKLLPFNPTKDRERRLKQMQSLATALTDTGTEFSNELTYIPGMAPRSANSPILEKGGMQVLSKEDTETLNFCKSMMERGECPPLMIVFDPQEGFTVEADKSIKDLTIITEYVGDVDYLKNRENDDGDSIMTLLSASDPSQTLVICPDKRSNIARFINGINNHTPDGKKKQNLKCVRYNVNGECRVLLIANRDIRKGERLYYDYNGYEHEYPTEHFV